MGVCSRLAASAALVSALLGAGGCVPQDHGWAASYMADQSPKIPILMPANAPSITQEFRVNTGQAGHEGIDVSAPTGTPVIAAAGGVVTDSFFEPMYGNRVVIDHGTSAGGRHLRTVYKHLKERLVAPGTEVTRGQTIGLLGSTGALAGGIPHLHFEVHRQASAGSGGFTPVDPHRYWTGGEGRVTCFDPAADQSAGLTYPVNCR